MAFDKQAYCMKLLAGLRSELLAAEQAKEGYEQKVGHWDLLKEQIELHIEAVTEYLEDIDHDDHDDED